MKDAIQVYENYETRNLSIKPYLKKNEAMLEKIIRGFTPVPNESSKFTHLVELRAVEMGQKVFYYLQR